MKTLFGISWGSPASAIFFLLWIAVTLTLIYRFWWQRKMLSQLGGSFFNRMVCGYSTVKAFLKLLLFSIGFFFLCVALLRPQWDKKKEAVQQEGRDLFIALDISRSMLATDCAPDRLTCAKNKVKELLRLLECERVGLIVFSGSAFVQCPLTQDAAAFMLFLDALDVETISSGTTNVAAAISTSLQAFQESGDRKNKLLLLLSDGEDFSPSSMKDAVQEAGLHIFALGIGTTTGAPIPLRDSTGTLVGHQKDEKGTIVISRLNEDLLRTLAQDAGGAYIPMTRDNTDIKTLLSRVRQYEKERFDKQNITRLQEQYPYFLAVSFICFMLEWLL